MKKNKIVLDGDELELLEELDNGIYIDKPLSKQELKSYQQDAIYTKALQEKKQTTIRFSVQDLAVVKSKAKELGIGYQNLIQALVHNYATGKVDIHV